MPLHPFTGIKHWDKIGISVEESTRRLQRIAYIDRQLIKIEGAHVIACPEYEVKGAMARYSWEDAEHYDQLRNRCRQLRMNVVAFEKCPDEQLKFLMNKVLESPDTLHLLIALFEVVKPAQIEAIKSYTLDAQPLADEPTLRLFRHQMMEREEQIAWGKEAIRVLCESAGKDQLDSIRRWSHYLRQTVESAGGIDGVQRRTSLQSGEEFTTHPFSLPKSSPRDERFVSSVIKFKGISIEDSEEDRLKIMMYSRFFEMSTAEGVAYVLYHFNDKPWAFVYDLTRHLWDEVRHAWFGEAAMCKHGYNIFDAPNWIGFYEICNNLFTPEQAYLHLTVALEKSFMKYPPGKREEFEFCRDKVKDLQMTVYQDFDWADEVTHAGFGQKWVIDDMYGGDVRKATLDAEKTMEIREKFMSDYAIGEIPKGQSMDDGY